MVNLEKSFAKLIGRQPSEAEVKNLYRVRDALGLKENDALWLVLIALESYDAQYRKYPQLIGEQVQKAVEAQRSAIAAMAAQETRRALGTLSEAVSRTSEAVTSKVLQGKTLQSAGYFTLTLLLFGSLCTTVGFVLASGRIPLWAPASSDLGIVRFLFATLARTPAGWMAAILGASLSVGALWHARKEIWLQRRGGMIAACALLLAFSVATLWAAF